MTSVATQTPWSWLQDMKHSSVRGRHEDVQWIDRSTSTTPQFVENMTKGNGDDSKDIANDENSTLTESSDLKDAPCDAVTPEIHTDGHTNHTVEESSLPVEEENTKEKLQLPEIVYVTGSRVEEIDSEKKTLSLPPLLDILETLNFEFPESPSHDSPESSAEDELKDDDDMNTDEQSEGEESDDTLNGSLKLKLDNLPLPSILQYIRESDSLASNYFSLQNKSSVEARLPTISVTAPAPKNVKEVDINALEESETDELTKDGSDGTTNPEETSVVYTCDFCGSPIATRHSLLDRINTENKSDVHHEEETFCCEEYKEFSVLVAACMRQMVERLHYQTPKKISVKHPVQSKKQLKKTAHDKALAMMRRRQKWEELQRKKNMKKHVKMKKNTTTIQFSLVSPDVMETGWVVRPKSTDQKQQPSQRRTKKKRGRARTRHKVKDIDIVPLEAETLERLKQEALEHMPPGDSEEKQYSDGQRLSVVLPDRTGQYFYHSGNKAVLVFTPYPGVLAYLVMADSNDEFQLLAYLDELGRACCYNKDGSIRLLVVPSTALSFDQHGSLRRRWTWNDTTSPSHFQPITLALNKQLTFKWSSRETFILTFNATQQQHIKFIIKSKLKNDTLIPNTAHKNIEALETHLAQTKGKISQLLQILQQSNRIQKLAELQSIYAPQKQGARVTIQQYGPYSRDMAHKRTKSTGAITLQTRHTQ